MITAARPHVLIARAVFPEVVDKLRQHFEVEANAADDIWPREELIRRLQGKQGVFTTGSERIDAALLAQVPSVIVPEEHNLLVNPAHPHAAQLRVTKLRRWLYDPRALRLPA